MGGDERFAFSLIAHFLTITGYTFGRFCFSDFGWIPWPRQRLSHSGDNCFISLHWLCPGVNSPMS